MGVTLVACLVLLKSVSFILHQPSLRTLAPKFVHNQAEMQAKRGAHKNTDTRSHAK